MLCPGILTRSNREKPYMKTKAVFVWLICMGLISPRVALADAAGNEDYSTSLKEIAGEGEQRSFNKAGSSREEVVDVTNLEPEPKFTEPDSKDVISGLLDKVEELKNKVVVTKKVSLETKAPKNAVHVGSSTVYPFIEGKLYEVHCGVDKVTDVVLEIGERLTSVPVSGDTVRWKVSSLTSGEGVDERTHLILKPLESDLETNLIITTNKRVYHLQLLSSDWYMPQVSWNYPEEEALKNQIQITKAKEVENISLAPEKLRFDYEIEGEGDFKPELIFDDGNKTYIRMPKGISGTEAPALFVLSNEDEAMLVNYRVKGQFYIVDRLFQRAELKVGVGSGVSIISPSYERSFFERIF